MHVISREIAGANGVKECIYDIMRIVNKKIILITHVGNIMYV